MTRSLLLDPEDAVLVVIEVQERLLPHIHGGDRVVDVAGRLVRVAKRLGLPILWTEQEKLGHTVEPLRKELEGIKPVTKVTFSCFGCDRFVQQVAATGTKTLVLTGIEAHICVAQTALQGIERHRVHVVGDGVSSRSPHSREIALERLRQAGVVVTSYEMVVYELLQQAGTDDFRAILPLVK